MKITVELIPAATAALVTASERTGLNRADTINRALQVYEAVTKAFDGDPAHMRISDVDGLVGALVVQPPRQRRWQWFW